MIGPRTFATKEHPRSQRAQSRLGPRSVPFALRVLRWRRWRRRHRGLGCRRRLRRHRFRGFGQCGSGNAGSGEAGSGFAGTGFGGSGFAGTGFGGSGVAGGIRGRRLRWNWSRPARVVAAHAKPPARTPVPPTARTSTPSRSVLRAATWPRTCAPLAERGRERLRAATDAVLRRLQWFRVRHHRRLRYPRAGARGLPQRLRLLSLTRARRQRRALPV